jgi:hypothetical protein
VGGARCATRKEARQARPKLMEARGGGAKDDEEDWTREEDGGGRTFASRNRATQ